MIGTTVSHYRITDLIGEGGMGTVYLAHDTELDRRVAVKVIRAELADDEERVHRFLREARITGSLNHPNILTVYELGTWEGAPFLVTELLDGETLREVLERDALPVAKSLEYARAIAAGLSSAHERGIVHRDLKPDNVFLTIDGRIKILDFGLARLTATTSPAGDELEAETELQTSAGAVMGTLGYMAPEQLRGHAADHRADIFALGCVLYEMLTGQRPFTGRTVADTSAAVLTEDPAPMSSSDRPIPAALEPVVLRCLEKRPDDRFQSTRDLVFALGAASEASDRSSEHDTGTPRRIGHVLAVLVAVVIALLVVLPPEGLWQRLTGEAERAPIRSIAVLPLENLSGDPEQEYFADGMTEELITNLTKIGSIDVISRTSVMRYRGSALPLPQIARELAVDAVIEGSVMRGENDVRITVQLVDAATDRHLWAESYTRPLRDVLTLQGEVALAVAREVDVTLTKDEEQRLERSHPVDPEVHQEYLRGMHQVLKFTDQGFRSGIRHLERAIELDPTFAPAYAGLGIAHSNSTYFLGVPPADSFPLALAAAEEALERDPYLADAHTLKGWVAMVYGWDFDEAAHELSQAIELAPSQSSVHQIYSYLLSCRGRHEEALAEAQRATRLDPLSPVTAQHLAVTLYFARHYDESLDQLGQIIDLHPDYWFAFQRRAVVLTELGRFDEAIQAAHRAMSLAGSATLRNGLEVLGPPLALSGRRAEALDILADFERRAEQSYVPPCDIARLHVALGNHDEAFRWLERAVEVHDGDLFMARVWPVWDPIRDDPRFDELLRTLGLSDG